MYLQKPRRAPLPRKTNTMEVQTHDAGQNPNKDDPDKGEDTGVNQHDPDYPPSLLEVAERPLPKLLEAEEVAESVYRGVVVFNVPLAGITTSSDDDLVSALVSKLGKHRPSGAVLGRYHWGPHFLV